MDRKQTRDAAFKETKDLAFASYAHMRGLKIIKATQWKKGTSIEYRFTFSDPPTDESPEGREAVRRANALVRRVKKGYGVYEEIFVAAANSGKAVLSTSSSHVGRL